VSNEQEQMPLQPVFLITHIPTQTGQPKSAQFSSSIIHAVKVFYWS